LILVFLFFVLGDGPDEATGSAEPMDWIYRIDTNYSSLNRLTFWV
jgi:hypothetical protein